MYLAWLDDQIDRIIGNESTKSLGDTSQFELQRDLQSRFSRTKI
jgi:hypothetical protein